ncbi:hypothetical protein [Amycolatopsis azurea]|uniref:Secreted protein n=1 Tax=Amycolatopsis azurea DSM 43854 TaxID=1238180 RepID=M2PY86_9PSEU|nr:hypothetical protein [Amycolatopsis azurea]EMD29588.1 hypothetical protein C791_4438 [Amycolatopsis azurea DSM 43854]OOC02641.1 hypothetical protein B0293_31300 [Amycolatopsis azurea DSM 43854]
MLSRLRQIACFLSVLMLSVGVVGAASAATTTPAAARAAFSPTSVELSTSGGDVSATAIACEVSVGNDVTIYGGFLNVTWAIACRDTATGQLTNLARDITMTIGIRKGGKIVAPISAACVTPGPSATCSHRVPYDGFTGRVDSAMVARVTWTDNYPPISGGFVSPGSIIG